MQTAAQILIESLYLGPVFRVPSSRKKVFDRLGPYARDDLMNHPGLTRTVRGRSRWSGHVGAKKRARHAGKPDGQMHVTGHQRREALLAAAKPARKSRAKVAS